MKENTSITPIKNEALKVLYLNSFTANTAIRPQVLAIGLDNVKPLIENAKSVAGGKDVALLTLTPGLQFAVGISPEFMEAVLADTKSFGKPDAALGMEVMGGAGVLSLSANPGNEPYQRVAGRGSVNEYFNKHLTEKSFAENLRKRELSLLTNMMENPDVPYDKIAKKLRLEQLHDLYFGESITQKEMAVVYEYAEAVFGKLLTISLWEGYKEKTGQTRRDMTPWSVRSIQKKADTILTRVIDERLASGNYGKDLFGYLMQGIVPNWENHGQEMKLEIVSGFLQILFASGDTTPSGKGTVLKKLAESPDLQDRMRVIAKDFIATKENKLVEYSDLSRTKDPSFFEFFHEIGHMLAEHPPTPTTARKALVDIQLADGTIIKKGTNVFLILGEAQMREWAKQDKEKLMSFADLFGIKIFGTGPTLCVGRMFAMYEIVASAIYMLDQTDSFVLAKPKEVVAHLGTTFRNENMKFKFNPASLVN